MHEFPEQIVQKAVGAPIKPDSITRPVLYFAVRARKRNCSRFARGKKEEGDQFFCGKPENSTPMVLAAAVVCGVFGRRAMVFANMAGSFFSPIA